LVGGGAVESMETVSARGREAPLFRAADATVSTAR